MHGAWPRASACLPNCASDRYGSSDKSGVVSVIGSGKAIVPNTGNNALLLEGRGCRSTASSPLERVHGEYFDGMCQKEKPVRAPSAVPLPCSSVSPPRI